jgi:hypothetical protein
MGEDAEEEAGIQKKTASPNVKKKANNAYKIKHNTFII